MGSFYTAGLAAVNAGDYDTYLSSQTLNFLFLDADYVFDASHENYSDLSPYLVRLKTDTLSGRTWSGGVLDDTTDLNLTNESLEDDTPAASVALVRGTFDFAGYHPIAWWSFHGDNPFLFLGSGTGTLIWDERGLFDTADVPYDPLVIAPHGTPPSIARDRWYDGARTAVLITTYDWENDTIKARAIGARKTDPDSRYSFDSSHTWATIDAYGSWGEATLTTGAYTRHLPMSSTTITLDTVTQSDTGATAGQYVVTGFVIYHDDGGGTQTPLFYVDSASNGGLPFVHKSGAAVTVMPWQGHIGSVESSDGSVFQPAVTKTRAPDELQYDSAVLEWVERTLRAELAGKLTDFGVQELAGSELAIVTETPADAAIQARSEGSLDERGAPPQHTAGVWARITQSDDHHHLNYGVGYTTHRLEVRSFACVTDQPDATTPTTQPSGYKKATRLARAVQVTLERNLGSAYGVVNLRRTTANRIARPVKGRPSWHEIIDTYDVLQRVYRRLSQEE